MGIKRVLSLISTTGRTYRHVTSVGLKIAPTISGEVRGYGETQLAVTPMVRVLKSAKNSMTYAISPYVGGERGDDINNESWTLILQQLAVAVMEEARVMGIVTLPSNSKMQTWYKPNRIEVTDLCAHISRLRKR